eukprot:jgi/Mesvir1/28479/Mv15899-RA.1
MWEDIPSPGTARQSLLGLGHCRLLRSLTVAGCPDVDSDVLMIVAAACRDLERLDICNFPVTDKVLFAVALYSTRLKELLVGPLKTVTDAAVFKRSLRGAATWSS